MKLQYVNEEHAYDLLIRVLFLKVHLIPLLNCLTIKSPKVIC